jgi:hypothetical protein
MREITFTSVKMADGIEVRLKAQSGQVEYLKFDELYRAKEVPYTYGSKQLLEDAQKLAKALKINENTLIY